MDIEEELASHRFLWVTEFPLFTRADEDKEFLASGRWSSSHHPFTAPMVEDLHLIGQGNDKLSNVSDPCLSFSHSSRLYRFVQVRGQHYDLVLNGMEIAGGSVRVHDAKLQETIFRDVLEVGTKSIVMLC
jgi:aspartyl-tRNA synthetase